MQLLGAHRINSGRFDDYICRQIDLDNGLLAGVGATYFGSGVYAFYPAEIPARFRRDPFLIFQASYQRAQLDIRHVRTSGSFATADRKFFLLPASPGTLVRVGYWDSSTVRTSEHILGLFRLYDVENNVASSACKELLRQSQKRFLSRFK